MWRRMFMTAAILGLYATALGAGDVKPRVVQGKGGMPALVLPDSLKAAVRIHNPCMRLRGWEGYGSYFVALFRRQFPKAVPWAAWGDFDGDGRPDVALDLLYEDGGFGKVVAYHRQPAGGWRAHLVVEYGTELVRYPICVTAKARGREPSPHDSLVLGAPNSKGSVFYWEHGRYHERVPASGYLLSGTPLGPRDVMPHVRIEHGKPALALPQSLSAAIRRYNPKMRLPSWDDFRRGLYLDTWSPRRLPWATWGDFDGNGRTDVALFMRNAEHMLWKAVAYHQRRDGGWRAHLIFTEQAYPSQRDAQCTWISLVLGRRRLWYEADWDRKKDEPIMRQMWLSHDAIGTGCDSKGGFEMYHWRRGRYHQICLSSD